MIYVIIVILLDFVLSVAPAEKYQDGLKTNRLQS